MPSTSIRGGYRAAASAQRAILFSLVREEGLRNTRIATLVIAGLDPAIHRLRKNA
jgi:hypothetical protein